MDNKKFKEIDESFICEVCGKKVEKLNYSSRDHCNFCLSSKHVDINPGDREETCHGILEPVGFEKYKDTYKIVYKCKKCGQTRKCVMASDDDFDKMLEIMKESSY